MTRLKYGAILRVKNEGPYLLDWISYYISIGFNNIIIISNDTTDGSKRLLKALARENIIIYRDITRMPFKEGESIGSRSIRYARKYALSNDLDWAIVVDADEYLFLKRHATIEEFIDTTRCSQIIIGPKCFIPSDKQIIISSGEINSFMMKRYWRSFPQPMVKSISNLSISRNLNPHRVINHPDAPTILPNNYIIPNSYRSRRIFGSKTINDDTSSIRIFFEEKEEEVRNSYYVAQLNHYMYRSAEEYILMRWERGVAGPNHLKNNSIRYISVLENHKHDDHTYDKSESNIIIDIEKKRDKIAYQLLSVPGVSDIHGEILRNFDISCQNLEQKSPMYKFIKRYSESNGEFDPMKEAESISLDFDGNFSSLYQLALVCGECGDIERALSISRLIKDSQETKGDDIMKYINTSKNKGIWSR